jgi:hypothetical protein
LQACRDLFKLPGQVGKHLRACTIFKGVT